MKNSFCPQKIFRRLFIFFAILSFLFIGCKKDNPINPEEGNGKFIKYVQLETNLTELTFQLSFSDDLINKEILIVKDSIAYLLFKPQKKDTTIVLTNLLPEKEYTFQFIAYHKYSQTAEKIYVSRDYIGSTLDTTSHEVEWTKSKISDYGVINSLKVISDNEIWAVGCFYNNVNEKYNLAKWHGNSWELKKIEDSAMGSPRFAYLSTIEVINEKEINIYGGPLIKWKNGNFNCINPGYPNDVFVSATAKNKNNETIYVGDEDGRLFSKDGNNWKMVVQPPFSQRIRSIFMSGEGNYVWVVSNRYDNNYSAFIYIKDGHVFSLYAGTGYGKVFKALWGENENYVYVLNDEKIGRQNRDSVLRLTNIVNVSSNAVNFTGTLVNDLFICGNSGYLAHFNGNTLFTYPIQGYTKNLTHISIGKRTVATAYYGNDINDGPVEVLIGRRN